MIVSLEAWGTNAYNRYAMCPVVPELDFIIFNERKRTCKIVDFAILADHRIKLKESEKKDNYLDLAGNSKNCRT